MTGVLEHVEDAALREEIFQHPTREFLRAWKDNGIDGLLPGLRSEKRTATEWTMETNFEDKRYVEL